MLDSSFLGEIKSLFPSIYNILSEEELIFIKEVENYKSCLPRIDESFPFQKTGLMDGVSFGWGFSPLNESNVSSLVSRVHMAMGYVSKSLDANYSTLSVLNSIGASNVEVDPPELCNGSPSLPLDYFEIQAIKFDSFFCLVDLNLVPSYIKDTII